MAASTLAELHTAAKKRQQHIQFGKTANLGSQTTGQHGSFYRIAGFPTAGNIPSTSTPAICSNLTTGSFSFRAPYSGEKTYLYKVLFNTASGAVTGYEIHDRLVENAGFSGTVTTAQDVDLDLDSIDALDQFNLPARIGATDYSEVQWFLEWFTVTGSTAVLVNYTYLNQAGTSRTSSVAATSSMAAGRTVRITPSPSFPQDQIRAIVNVTLSATTGTAGNFGVFASVPKAVIVSSIGSQALELDWAQLGCPVIENQSCLFLMALATATTIQAPLGSITLVQG